MNQEIGKFLDPKDFGRGTMMGNDPTIQDLPPEQRLLVSAWRHACPRPDMVVNYYGEAWRKTQPDPDSIPPEVVTENGIRMTRQRYDECNFVFKQLICDMASTSNTPLYEQLTAATPRLHIEPVGMYETGRVPQTHRTEMSPMSTLVGYALPRVFIELAGRGSERTAHRYFTAMDVLEEQVQNSKSPVELLARMTEMTVASGVEPNVVLSHVLEPGIFQEEQNLTEYARVADALAAYAPTTWEHYKSLTAQEKEAAGIASLPLP